MPTTIVSRRHRIKFYGSLFAVSVFLTVLGSVFFIPRRDGNGKMVALVEEMPLLLAFSVAAYLFVVYTIYRYYKNAPVVRLTSQSVSFNGEVFALDTLKQLRLTGKWDFPFLGSSPMEGARLEFNDGRAKFLFDDMYENAWQMKSFLEQAVLEKKMYMPVSLTPVNKEEIGFQEFEDFKNNQFFSFQGIVLWGTVVAFVTTVLAKRGRFDILLVICLAWIAGLSFFMNYFRLSNNFLVITNHNFFWRARVFRLSDIREIVFETRGKMPNCLRVITKDYKSRLYPAGTLRDKTWLALKDKLEQRGIPVRNESIHAMWE